MEVVEQVSDHCGGAAIKAKPTRSDARRSKAAADGLWVHQMGGFSADRAREVFGIPENHAAITAIAIGELGDAEALPDELRQRETAPRQRKPLATFTFGSRWGEPSELISSNHD